MIQTINKSLLESNTKYIAHQCNCITNYAAGIAKIIFDKFPWSNTYKLRENKRISTTHDKIAGQSDQGSIDILGNGVDKRYVINMYIQRKPGKPNGYSLMDQGKDRLKWLKICLNQISKIENIESIAFPEGMGCRLAGGRWESVLLLLEEFSEQIYNNQKAITYLYRYDNRSIIQENLF